MSGILAGKSLAIASFGISATITHSEWKWEVISMDFIMGLRKIKNQNDSIFVLVDKLSKAVHFIPVKLTYKAVHISKIFLKEILILRGIPKAIISDRDRKFT